MSSILTNKWRFLRNVNIFERNNVCVCNLMIDIRSDPFQLFQSTTFLNKRTCLFMLCWNIFWVTLFECKKEKKGVGGWACVSFWIPGSVTGIANSSSGKEGHDCCAQVSRNVFHSAKSLGPHPKQPVVFFIDNVNQNRTEHVVHHETDTIFIQCLMEDKMKICFVK